MFRRDRKLFIGSLRTLAVLVILIGTVCLGTVLSVSGAETGKAVRFSVALCNLDRESRYGNLALSAASNHELVTSFLDVAFYDTEEEAVQAVREGASCAVILPEGFFRSTSRGESLPCRMILGTGGEGGRATILSYAQVGTRFLTTGQQIVFTGDAYMMETGADSEDWDSFNLYLNLVALNEFEASQSAYFDKTTVPYTRTGMSKTGHYAALYFAFFLQILILGLYRLFQSDMDRSRLLRLRASGIHDRSFLLWKWLLPFLFMLVLSVCLLFPASRLMPLQIRPETILAFLTALLLTSVTGALASIAFSRISGAVLFAVHIFGLFTCGGIVPYSRLQPWLLALGGYTPLGVIYRLIGTLFGSRLPWLSLLFGILYLSGALFLCRQRIRRVLGGEESFLLRKERTVVRSLYLRLTIRTALSGGLLLFVIAWAGFGYARVSETRICAVCTEDLSAEASSLLSSLSPEDFRIFPDRASVIRAIQDGDADCGMILKDGYRTKLEQADLRGCMELLVSPLTQLQNYYTVNAAAALYERAAPGLTMQAFRQYGYDVSFDTVRDYFARTKEEITPLSFIATNIAGQDLQTQPNTDLPLGLIGIAGFLLYGFLLIGRVRPQLRNVRPRFSSGRLLLHAALPRIIPIGFCLALCALSGAWFGSQMLGIPFLSVGFSIIVFFLLQTVFFSLLLLVPDSDHTLICLVAVDAVCSLVLCPLFWDLAAIIPAIRYIRWICVPYWIY